MNLIESAKKPIKLGIRSFRPADDPKDAKLIRKAASVGIAFGLLYSAEGIMDKNAATAVSSGMCLAVSTIEALIHIKK